MRKAAQRLRITAQLIDATTGTTSGPTDLRALSRMSLTCRTRYHKRGRCSLPEVERAEIARAQRKATEAWMLTTSISGAWPPIRRSREGNDAALRDFYCASSLAQTWQQRTPWLRWRTRCANLAAGSGSREGGIGDRRLALRTLKSVRTMPSRSLLRLRPCPVADDSTMAPLIDRALHLIQRWSVYSRAVGLGMLASPTSHSTFGQAIR